MKMNQVLLIAVGNIGFRHFQALLNCRSAFDLHVVEISNAAIARAKAYAAENANGRTIHYHGSLEEIPSPTAFHTAIIATSSIPRRAAFEELISLHSVKNVIFEKVLFPRIEDYTAVEKLLDQTGINAYVDCICRVADVYTTLRQELASQRPLYFSMSGGNWGLACNSIHSIDLFAFLAGLKSGPFSCSSAQLENKLYESKRSGYIEFYGKLVGNIGEQASFSIECTHDQATPTIEIYTDKTYYCVCESEGWLLSHPLDGSACADMRHFSFPFVSQTTTQVVDRLFSGGPAGLTDYKESAQLHIAILKEFIKKRNALLEKEEDLCPIT